MKFLIEQGIGIYFEIADLYCSRILNEDVVTNAFLKTSTDAMTVAFIY